MKHYLNQLVASQYFSFVVTVLLFVILYAAGIMTYKGFMRPQVFLNLFIDNAALIIVTVGITFTLLIGGIDLSVGAVLALCCMVLAYLLEFTTVPVGLAILIILLMGIGFGALQGYIITKFDLQPFIITLAGMFFWFRVMKPPNRTSTATRPIMSFFITVSPSWWNIIGYYNTQL